MSRETAIQEVAEICAALENDSPEDNLELARLIVETVERNLTKRAADFGYCVAKIGGFILPPPS